MKTAKIKVIVWVLIALIGVGAIAGVAVEIALNKNNKNNTGEPAEHIYVVDYAISQGENVGDELVISAQERCTLCGEKKQERILDTSEYTLIYDTEIDGNTYTLSQSGVYILQGDFNGTTFIVDAENVSLIGSEATTQNMRINCLENSSNTCIYGLNFPYKPVTPISINVYGDINFIKCNFSSFWLISKKQNINFVIDSCDISGEYGVEIFYTNSQGSGNENVVPTDKVAGYFTNNTFDAIGLYSIFFCGQDSNAEIRQIEIVNNRFINGWGDNKAKRAVLKLNIDKNITPVDYDDITDTSLLTDSAKSLVTKILNSNNTFDKAGKECSYFNFRGIYFDKI